MKQLLVILVLATVGLSGCTDEAVIAPDDIPIAISREQVEALEARLLEKDPREFSFPGQAVAEPVLRIINETLSPGSGIGLEPVNDNGAADFAGQIVPHDISDMVPAGQPVELRIAVKWFGDPGAAADVDLYINVPGTYTTKSSGDEQSWNWAIINKQSVVNTARIEGEPFEIGLQVQNGKIIHPDGMRYSLKIEAHFVEGVVAPFVPWGLTLPEGATGLIIESEPVVGDEHVTTELVVIAPDDTLHRVVVHNDIGTETLFIPAVKPGEYVVYVAEQHGGFIRIEADVPNPSHLARLLPKTVTEIVTHSTVIAPGDPTAGYSETGDIDTGALPALDVVGFMRGGAAGSANVELLFDVISGGVVHSLSVAGSTDSPEGRIGQAITEVHDRSQMTNVPYTYGLRGNFGIGTELGVTVVGYTR